MHPADLRRAGAADEDDLVVAGAAQGLQQVQELTGKAVVDEEKLCWLIGRTSATP